MASSQDSKHRSQSQKAAAHLAGVTTKPQGKDSGVTQLLFANKKEEIKESEGR